MHIGYELFLSEIDTWSGSASLKYKTPKPESVAAQDWKFVLLFAGWFSLTEFAECLVVEETPAMRKTVTANSVTFVLL